MIPEGYNTGDLLWLGDWGPLWIGLLIALGVLVIGVSAYDLRQLSRARQLSLVTLRALVYLLAVAMLLEPAIDLKNVSRVKNHVAVLVDTSASMSLKVDEAGVTRKDRVNEVLPELTPLMAQHDEEHVFSFFTFGHSAQELSPSSLEAMRQAPASGKRSDLSGALQAVQERFEGEELAGVLIYSDGIDSGAIGARTRRGESLDVASKALITSLNAPVNAYAAATAEGLRDVAIARVLRDDFAFVHNKVSVDVELQAIGVGDQRLPVTLFRDGEPLQTREVQITGEQTRYTVRFEFVPRQIGQEIYTVELPVLPNEALESNNRAHFLLKVIRDKIRALQVVGQPSWDERFMRRLLKRNPNVDLISFFILRTNDSLSNASTDELSLIPFPTEELFEQELGSFDLVIFQNFNFGPYKMRQYLPRIEEFIRKGGGFVMIGGELSFASGGYARTPIEEALPVTLPPTTGKTLDLKHFRPELTRAGLTHPITQLAFDPATNKAIWAKLPPQHGTNIVLDARKGATVLATHPTLTPGGEPMPVITIDSHGEGRVMALTTDSTWRWGFEHLGDGGTPREYQLFWNNAIRWLIKDPELKLLKIDLSEDTFRPGEEVTFSVRVSQPDYSPAANRPGEVRLEWRPLHGSAATKEAAPELTPLTFKTSSAGLASLRFTPSRPGVYRLVASAEEQEGAGELTDQTLILVVPDAQEFQDIIPRDDLLEQLARESGGRLITLGRAGVTTPALLPPRTVKINRRRVIQLWDSALTFLVILALLAMEWTLRRRWGRL